MLLDTTSQSALIGNWLVRDRILALLSAFFSAVAIVLVVVGLYGVLSYSVIQRRRELGIRMALGARPLRVIALVISDVGAMAVVGLVTGAAGAFAAARFVTALLYDVSPSDSWAIAVPLACLVLVCALAAVLPALRAIRVDPTSALRCEEEARTETESKEERRNGAARAPAPACWHALRARVNRSEITFVFRFPL